MTVSSLSSCRHTASYSHENEEDLHYILEGERSNKDVLLPNYLYGIKQLTSIHVRKNGFGKI
ncbi:hypothetical protein [Aeribacillus alveayuensis]|uniref:Uncharacterized protein n=1 Tax=Aeribacillus alveayuensis TaxID=279215 RepID=A0ABT9VS47_9BACI|nr:hypothetical protein [Bacillus alveayuensis]